MSEEIRFIDLFRGIGGFHLGLERSNKISGDKQYRAHSEEGSSLSLSEKTAEPHFSCVWSNDIDKYASQIYKKHWPETPEVTGDIRGIDEKGIPKHDLICAGFPCQTFSVAGKRKGFEDTRGTLFFEICRIAAYHRPELLLLENVKGLLNHDGGRTFATILYALEDLGYWWEYQVLNSKNYGVPQNRERVFIVGHLRTGSSRPIFPIIQSNKITNERDAEKQIASTLQSPGHAAGNYRGMNMIASRIPLKFLGRNEKNWIKDEAYTVDSMNTGGVAIATGVNMPSRGPEPRKDMLASTLKVSHPNPIMVADFRNDEGLRIRENGLAPTLTARKTSKTDLPTMPGLIINDLKIRRLTPTECERLQGFPDGWTEGVSDTQRYKCLGNAVTVNVPEYLGGLLKASINSKSLRIDQK